MGMGSSELLLAEAWPGSAPLALAPRRPVGCCAWRRATGRAASAASAKTATSCFIERGFILRGKGDLPARPGHELSGARPLLKWNEFIITLRAASGMDEGMDSRA